MSLADQEDNDLQTICHKVRDDVSSLQKRMDDLHSRFGECSAYQCTLIDQQTELIKLFFDREPRKDTVDREIRKDPVVRFNSRDTVPDQNSNAINAMKACINGEAPAHLPYSRMTVPAGGSGEQGRFSTFGRVQTTKLQKKSGPFDFARQLRTEARSDLDEELYDVANFYHEDGFAARIAKSERFINFTLSVVAANALYLGIDTDWNNSDSIIDADWPFILCENLFCTYFVFEWVVRFLAFASKWDCMKDSWFKFDTVLVLIMTLETWMMPLIFITLGNSSSVSLPTAPLRLFRLLRLTRMVRLLRSMPELVTLIKGLATASRAVGSSLLMVSIVMYVFAITLNLIMKGEPWNTEKFDTVLSTLWTLMINGALVDEVFDVLQFLREAQNMKAYISIALFMVFVLIVVLTILNMLIGIMVEVVKAVASSEQEVIAIRFMKETILLMLKEFDVEGRKHLNQEQFNGFIAADGTLSTLREVDVDVLYVMEMANVMYSDTQTLSFENILDLLLTSRADIKPTVSHMARCHAFVHWSIVSQTSTLRAFLDDRLRETTDRLREIVVSHSQHSTDGRHMNGILQHEGLTASLAVEDAIEQDPHHWRHAKRKI
eukprot:TRINITY_DN23905_c0_g1_i1.p1 TRINITY_DN23905_c0_g1~~TRINITY_DN23905_c0_g1_i1.p1  ORF type:complete len:619 (-),score=96.67 TRINITY_DN23905_c0_g1_i1:359-2173(-)